MRAARAARLFCLVQPIRSLCSGVVVAVAARRPFLSSLFVADVRIFWRTFKSNLEVKDATLFVEDGEI